MTSKPLFSVLLPTHNRPDVISYSIKSLLDQTCEDFELLIVGDGASNETARAVSAFGDPRIKWFDLPKAAGFGYANRNTVLKEARGEYVAFAADDDLLLPHHLMELERLLRTGAALACTRAAWISSDGIAAPFLTNLDLQDEREVFLARHNTIPASCFAYRADALPEKGVWPEHEPKGGDWHIWRRIINTATDKHLACSPSFTVLHFSAKRKNARDSRMPELRRLLEFADRSHWWPDQLRVEVLHESSAQAAWAERIRNAGSMFSDEFGAAIRLVIDRLAWEYVHSTLHPYARKLTATSPKAVLPPDFDPTLYLKLHPDVASSGVDPVRHWMAAGYFEGRAYKDYI